MTTENTNTEVKTVGTVEGALDKIITALSAIKPAAAEFDTDDFKKKADLNKCSSDIRKDVQGVRKVMQEFAKAVNDETTERRSSFDGTPEERVKRQEEKIKKMQASFEKAKQKLAADKAALK